MSVQACAHQRLHRLDADTLLLRLLEHARQVGLHGDHVHLAQEALVELRVLAEVEGDEDRVGEIVIERVVEALDQLAGVTGHAGEADLPLLLRVGNERLPLGVLQPLDVVDGVVQVDVDPVGAEAPEAFLEAVHELGALAVGGGDRLARDRAAVALPRERAAERLLRHAAAVALGRVEVGDAGVECVADEVLVAFLQPEAAEPDVGDT
jgi:hypothetical protein